MNQFHKILGLSKMNAQVQGFSRLSERAFFYGGLRDG